MNKADVEEEDDSSKSPKVPIRRDQKSRHQRNQKRHLVNEAPPMDAAPEHLAALTQAMQHMQTHQGRMIRVLEAAMQEVKQLVRAYLAGQGAAPA